MTTQMCVNDTNPFRLRRLRWNDSRGRQCSTIVPTRHVAAEINKLRESGITDISIDKLQWVEA